MHAGTEVIAPSEEMDILLGYRVGWLGGVEIRSNVTKHTQIPIRERFECDNKEQCVSLPRRQISYPSDASLPTHYQQWTTVQVGNETLLPKKDDSYIISLWSDARHKRYKFDPKRTELRGSTDVLGALTGCWTSLMQMPMFRELPEARLLVGLFLAEYIQMSNP